MDAEFIADAMETMVEGIEKGLSDTGEWDLPPMFWVIICRDTDTETRMAAVPVPRVSEDAEHCGGNPCLAMVALAQEEPPPFHEDVVGVAVAFETWMLDGTQDDELAQEMNDADLTPSEHSKRQETRMVMSYGRDGYHRTVNRTRQTGQVLTYGPDSIPLEGDIKTALEIAGQHVMQIKGNADA